MNIPTSLEAIIILVIVFIPGYIFLQFTKRTVEFSTRDVDARYFFALIVWGGIIHGCSIAVGISNPLELVDWYVHGTLEDHASEIIFWALRTLLFAPIALAVLLSALVANDWVDRTILRAFRFDYQSRIPSAWNYALHTGTAFVRIHMNDGTMIGGLYGPQSFANDESDHDIFLQTIYNLDENGDFMDAVPATAGIWIPRSSINYMLFFRNPVATPDSH